MTEKREDGNQSAATESGPPAACSPPVYEIEHVRDFLKVPEDRLQQCLVEFAEFLKLSREMMAVASGMAEVLGIEGPGGEVTAYQWTDDGLTEKHVTFVLEAERHGRRENKAMNAPPADSSVPPLEMSAVRWEYEDELPEMTDAEFTDICAASRVDIVRLYPFVEDSRGNRIWITSRPSAPNAAAQASASTKL